jgi:hypothetical protein
MIKSLIPFISKWLKKSRENLSPFRWQKTLRSKLTTRASDKNLALIFNSRGYTPG